MKIKIFRRFKTKSAAELNNAVSSCKERTFQSEIPERNKSVR